MKDVQDNRGILAEDWNHEVATDREKENHRGTGLRKRGRVCVHTLRLR